MKKLHSAAFALLMIAVCIGIICTVTMSVLLILQTRPLWSIAAESGVASGTLWKTVIYVFLRSIGVYIFQLILYIVWLVCLLRDRKKPTRRAYIMIMCGFHLFYVAQNVVTLVDLVYLGGIADLSLLFRAGTEGVYALIAIIVMCLLLLADLFVFIGYGIQKHAPTPKPQKKVYAARQNSVPPRNSYPPPYYSYPPPQNGSPSYPPYFPRDKDS